MIEPNITVDAEWVRDLEYVFKYGINSAPRNMEVREAIGYRSTVPMNQPIIYNPTRQLGYKFMAAEAAWILSGDNRVETIAPYSKEISKFSDDGQTFYGAYGPRIQAQLDYIIEKLIEDLDSRQAVLTIWRTNPPVSKDIPCTVSLQWLVRNGAIHCVANMRSSDLWLGHPYDVFNFSSLSFYLMMCLNNHRVGMGYMPLVLGTLYLNAGSKHIYGRNYDAVAKIIDSYSTGGEMSGTTRKERNSPFVSARYDSPDEFIQHLWSAANSPSGVKVLVPEN